MANGPSVDSGGGGGASNKYSSYFHQGGAGGAGAGAVTILCDGVFDLAASGSIDGRGGRGGGSALFAGSGGGGSGGGLLIKSAGDCTLDGIIDLRGGLGGPMGTGYYRDYYIYSGAYTYGTETMPDGSTARTFDLAVDTANHFQAERLLSATYPLDEHVDAIAHAAAAGRRGAVKIAFDLRGDQ